MKAGGLGNALGSVVNVGPPGIMLALREANHQDGPYLVKTHHA